MSQAPIQNKRSGKEWSPHLWQGMHFFPWIRLLTLNRCRVDWPFVHVVIIVTLVSLFHSCLKLVQDAWFGAQVRRTKISPPPVFIIGHWRTGTTLLHELFMLDKRHTCPTYYQCLDSNNFLLTEWLFKRLFWFFMPAHRPMDNMAAGWDRPQEDEFALCMLGLPSPYLSIAFPRNPPMDMDYLDLEGVPPRAVRKWKSTLYRFFQELTFHRPGRLVLKSPTHSCRIKLLLEMFPDARFVHIVRNPYVVYPSTINLWKALSGTHGLQTSVGDGLQELIFSTFTRLHNRLEEGRVLVDPARFHEVKYEDLVRDTAGAMRAIYEHLDLGGFEHVQPRIEEYVAHHRDYKTNRFEKLDAKTEAAITERWGEVIRRYGYEKKQSDTHQPEAQARGPSLGLQAGE